MDNRMIERIVKEVMASIGDKSNSQPQIKNEFPTKGVKAGVQDYPLATKRQDWVKSLTNKKLSDITLPAVLKGEITPNDVRIAPETLELQAQIAEAAGRDAFARNLRRAAELIAVPDDRILEIYNALRPNRSTKQELLEIASELESKYNARVNAGFVREAAEVYEIRNKLRKD